MIDRGYETFVGRCAEGRGMPVDSIKAIAEGRVWAGTKALEIGLLTGWKYRRLHNGLGRGEWSKLIFDY